jgi:malate dehydrogenase (oxaloacetate-decarboxylating)(NADP+)
MRKNYFAAMMVNEGEADALVTGHSRSYPSVVKPMLQLIEKRMELRLLPTNMMMTARANVFIGYRHKH